MPSARGPRLAVPLLALVALACGALAPRPASSGVWSNLEGLPIPQLTAVTGTDSGTVVVATVGAPDSAEVWEYDGIRFRRLSDRYPARPHFGSVITSLAHAPNGDLWVGTTFRGLFRLRADGFTRFTREDGLGNRAVDQITSLAVDAAGVVWAGTNGGGLSRYDGSGWTTVHFDQGLPSNFVNDVAPAPDGSLWISLSSAGGAPGLVRYAGGAVLPVAGSPAHVGKLVLASDGRLWATLSGTGAAVFGADGALLRTYGPPDVDTDLGAVAEGPHGDLWLGGTRYGLSRFNGAGWEQYAARLGSGLANDTVRDLYVDAAGVLWVATAGGLARYEGSLWLHFSPLAGQHALPGGAVRSLSRGPAADLPTVPARGITRGPVYAALAPVPPPATGGLVRLWGLEAEAVRDSAGAPLTGPFQAVSAVPGGAWASRNAEIFLIEGGSAAARWVTPDGADVFSLLGLEDGTAWAGTRRGLLRYDGAAWSARELAGFTPSKLVALARDGAGRLWIGSETACAARLDPVSGTLELFGGAQGLPSSNVRQIHVAAGGEVWLATDNGLALLRGTRVERVFGTADGLPSAVVLAVGEDQAGRVWAGTQNGLAYRDGETWATYNTGDGLASSVVTALLADTSEALLGSDQNGIALFRRDAVPPRAVVTVAPPEISGSRQASFVFGGGDLDSQGQYLRFTWRLDGGLDQPFSTETSARATGLTDGEHVFEVRARDRALNVTAAPARVLFQVDATPPQPVLVTPAFGSVVRGRAPVVAEVREPRFQRTRVDVRPAGESDPAENPWLVLAESVEPPAAVDTLATWDTAPFADGLYELRVSVVDTLGLVGYAIVNVTVDNLSPGDAETTPARINSAAGGRVYTLNAEVEVYFPPNALDEDRLIRIDTLATAVAPPPGAAEVLAAWEVAPAGLAMRKPVTLTFALAALGAGGTAGGGAPALPALGVFALTEDGTLSFLGGSVDAARRTLTTTTTRLGRFAVVRGLFAGAAAAGRALDVQPRAFSPKGTAFDDRAAISFDLPRGGDARVLVYDRAGRLVRRVHEGPLGPGRSVLYWDGRDGGGDTVPSGVYLVTVQAGGDTDVVPVAVVNR